MAKRSKNKKVKTYLIGFTNLNGKDDFTCVINKENNDVDIRKTTVITGIEARKLYNAIERLSNRRVKENKK